MRFVLYEIWLFNSIEFLVLLEYLVELDAIKSYYKPTLMLIKNYFGINLEKKKNSYFISL